MPPARTNAPARSGHWQAAGESRREISLCPLLRMLRFHDRPSQSNRWLLCLCSPWSHPLTHAGSEKLFQHAKLAENSRNN